MKTIILIKFLHYLQLFEDHLWSLPKLEGKETFSKRSQTYLFVSKKPNMQGRKSKSLLEELLSLTYPWTNQEHCPSWKCLDVTCNYLQKKHSAKRVNQDILEMFFFFSKMVFRFSEETSKGDGSKLLGASRWTETIF